MPITKEQGVKGSTFELYIAEKKFGEQAVLEFADQHPEMDITIVCPPWIFGPFAPGFEEIVPEPDFAAFSTNSFVYQLLRADNKNYHYSPGVLDVRDVARVHIAALNPLTRDHPKRVPVVSPYQADFRDAIRYIAEERPALRSRLPTRVQCLSGRRTSAMWTWHRSRRRLASSWTRTRLGGRLYWTQWTDFLISRHDGQARALRLRCLPRLRCNHR